MKKKAQSPLLVVYLLLLDELLEEGEVSVDPDDGLEVLVPIKLNIPLGNNKYLQDAFTWSLAGIICCEALVLFSCR